jgi:hypothetical protein
MLEINPVKIRHIVDEARLFDDNGIASGVACRELTEFIRSLDEEEQVNLVALAWLGRGTYGVSEWNEAAAEAQRVHNRRTAEYLISMPKLGDYLEEGLSMLEEAGQVDLEDPDAS